VLLLIGFRIATRGALSEAELSCVASAYAVVEDAQFTVNPAAGEQQLLK